MKRTDARAAAEARLAAALHQQQRLEAEVRRLEAERAWLWMVALALLARNVYERGSTW